MTARPFRVICQTETPTTLSYLSEWFPTPEDAQDAKEEHQREGWQRVDMVEPGHIPGASVTGKQVLAVGAMGPRRRRRSTQKGA